MNSKQFCMTCISVRFTMDTGVCMQFNQARQSLPVVLCRRIWHCFAIAMLRCHTQLRNCSATVLRRGWNLSYVHTVR